MRQAKFVFGGLIMAIAVSIQSLVAPIATATPQEPDWMNDDMIVQKSTTQYPTSGCRNETRQVKNNPAYYYHPDELLPKTWCIYHYKNYDITFYKRQFSSVLLDVADPLSMYPKEESGMAISYSGGVLVPVNGVDYTRLYRLVYVPNSESPLFYTDCDATGCAMTFDDFSKSIHQMPSGDLYEYKGGSDETITYSGGEVVKADGASASENGEWLSFQIFRIGLARMHLITRKWEIVGTVPANTPSKDYIPFTSISNDGNYVVLLTGLVPRMESYIIHYSAGCETTVPSRLNGEAQYRADIKTTCPLQSITSIFSNIRSLTGSSSFLVDNIHLSASADRMRIRINQDQNEWYDIYPSNTQYMSQLDYLALGDSYSSGEGDIDYNYGHSSHYLPLTNALGSYTLGIPRELCHLSDRSYPFLLARDMDTTRGENMQSVACSGAVRRDILSQPLIDSGFKNNPLYLGQSTNVTNFSTQPRLFGLANAEQLKSEARANFVPGRVQQAEFVKAKKPKVVTVGISGNDIGFGKVLTNCILHLVGNECYYASPKGLRDLGVIIEANYDSQLQFYKQLKQVSPGTDFYAVGYPQFISDDELLCWATPSLTTAARTMIRNAVSFANETIKRAAFAAGFKYIDIENVLMGSGALCSGSRKVSAPTEKVVYGIVTGIYFNFEDKYIIDSDNTIEDYILKNTHASYREAHEALRNNPITAVALFMQETFHPNARAHQAIYDYIHAHQNGTSLLDDTCDGVVILCSDGNIAAPDIPSYFYPAVKVNEIKHSNFMGRFGDVVGDYVAAGDFLTVARDETVRIDAMGGASASSAMMLHDASGEARLYVYENDTKRPLATFSNSSGVTFTMPSSTGAGSQVFALEVGGTTYLQPVFITGSTNDIDGDGILNEQDSCEFLPPKGTDIDGDGIDDNCDLKTNATNDTGGTIKAGNEVDGVRFADYDSQGNGMSFNIYQRNTSNVDEDPLVFQPELKLAPGSQKDMDSGMYIGVRYAILVLCFTLIAAPIAIVGGRKFKKGAYNSK